MTEKEYIKAKALGTITAAINTLKDLVPEIMDDVITKEEYRKVMPTLTEWQQRLFDKIEISEE